MALAYQAADAERDRTIADNLQAAVTAALGRDTPKHS
jgi:hypothetical protein